VVLVLLAAGAPACSFSESWKMLDLRLRRDAEAIAVEGV